MFRGLKIEHCLTEDFPLPDVVNSCLKSCFRRRYPSDCDLKAFPGEFLHEKDEALALGSETGVAGKLDILEEQLRRVLRVHAELFEIAALGEAGKAAIDKKKSDPFRAEVGSVFATTITRSAFWPLVMKVFEPLRT